MRIAQVLILVAIAVPTALTKKMSNLVQLYGIAMYSGKDFTGEEKAVYSPDQRTENFEVPFTVQSYKIMPGSRVKLYTENNCKGVLACDARDKSSDVGTPLEVRCVHIQTSD
jgi:hypothetical protein